MEKDKGKQTEREGSTAADVEAEDQEEPPVADGEGTRRRKRRKGSDEDDDGQALGPRKCWRATTGEEKKTKYSAREDEALLASVQAFCSAAGLGSTEEAVYRFIENKEWKNHRGCWIEIARALPDRSLASVFERAKRTLNKKDKKGPWDEAEEQLLLELYRKHGNNFQLIGAELGRWPTSVRDKVRVLESTKWRLPGASRTHAPWTQAEDIKLLKLVKKATDNFETNVPSGGSFWVEIAKRMKDRNYSQCRKRWSRALDKDVEKVGQWTAGENWLLLQNLVEGEYERKEDILWSDACRGLPFPPDVVHPHFRDLLLKHEIDGHGPLDEVLEALAVPLKAQYEEWVEAGKPEAKATKLSTWHREVQKLYGKDNRPLMEGDSTEDEAEQQQQHQEPQQEQEETETHGSSTVASDEATTKKSMTRKKMAKKSSAGESPPTTEQVSGEEEAKKAKKKKKKKKQQKTKEKSGVPPTTEQGGVHEEPTPKKKKKKKQPKTGQAAAELPPAKGKRKRSGGRDADASQQPNTKKRKADGGALKK
ncbi:Myblike DNA-binding domain containing protein [Acanthamoeba castellanii str. Neff]|uniref:Myblike DNA-binding domain containing protein n=1 Tax=Acanthamoeba castellanii (strain ATCC 30010 / Neff) TaxID=1257118 RepID=L8HCT3_ACACF|nr:Myblike DNA-binding domain containing protein [Acanthamoeba castellanii str. Neff]ELR22558.1 Myblike DNA-binding domain containing protein [Acanthamoeba castellanii str. Neff]